MPSCITEKDSRPMIPWKILIVDDEEGIHGITRMIFRDYEFEQRPIELISAMNSSQAREKLAQHPDIALILLDVVMETENAGLQLVETIRHQLGNRDVRIILRTGHPGYAPEAQVIIDYDINDYLSKAELSASRLLTSVIVALRSYRDIQSVRSDLSGDQHLTTESPGESGAIPEDELLPEMARVLRQHLTPAIKQSQRLHKLELNPVASDLAKDLHAHQLRLHNTLLLCETGLLPEVRTQPLSLHELMDDILKAYLPQSRQQGWILDYHLSAQLPQAIQTDKIRLELMITSAIELGLIQANGADLKVVLTKGDLPGEGSAEGKEVLLIQVEQTDGQPVFSRTPWAEAIRKSLTILCRQLNGRFSEIDESALLCCRIPV